MNALWNPDALEFFGSPFGEIFQALFDHSTSHGTLLEDVVLHGTVGITKLYPSPLGVDK